LYLMCSMRLLGRLIFPQSDPILRSRALTSIWNPCRVKEDGTVYVRLPTYFVLTPYLMIRISWLTRSYS
jgi:hypothetical protein